MRIKELATLFLYAIIEMTNPEKGKEVWGIGKNILVKKSNHVVENRKERYHFLASSKKPCLWTIVQLVPSSGLLG